jgi:hypothetical protein
MESYVADGKSGDSGLTLRAVSFNDQSSTSRVQLVVDFPLLEWQNKTWTFTAAVLGMVYKNDRAIEARFSDRYLEVNCRALVNSTLCGEFVPNHYETQLRLVPGDYDIRVVISFNGRLYGAAAAILVERYDHQAIATSGIALCKRFHPMVSPAPLDHTSLFMSEMSKNLPPAAQMPFELVPLVSKGIEFTPTSEARFEPKEALVAYFEVYEPRLAGAGAVKVQLQMRITDVKTGELKTDTGLRPADSFIQPGKAIIPIAEQIAINELSKGEYRLEVQASDSAGNHTDWRATSFTVE